MKRRSFLALFAALFAPKVKARAYTVAVDAASGGGDWTGIDVHEQAVRRKVISMKVRRCGGSTAAMKALIEARGKQDMYGPREFFNL